MISYILCTDKLRMTSTWIDNMYALGIITLCTKAITTFVKKRNYMRADAMQYTIQYPCGPYQSSKLNNIKLLPF